MFAFQLELNPTLISRSILFFMLFSMFRFEFVRSMLRRNKEIVLSLHVDLFNPRIVLNDSLWTILAVIVNSYLIFDIAFDS